MQSSWEILAFCRQSRWADSTVAASESLNLFHALQNLSHTNIEMKLKSDLLPSSTTEESLPFSGTEEVDTVLQSGRSGSCPGAKR